MIRTSLLPRTQHATLSYLKRLYSRETIGIIGGGAAGLMATIFAQKNANVILLERKEKCGRKIIMSGGSRCNVIPHESKWPTNDLTNRFFTSHPEIAKQILKTWSITDQYLFFQKDLHLPLSLEEETGKYFPESNDAKDVLHSFLRQFNQNTRVITSANVTNIEKKNNKFIISYNDNSFIECDKVIMSSGGISVINSDGSGYMLLKKLGHTIVPLYAALTPLLVHDKTIHKELSGISAENVTVSTYVNDQCVYTSDPNALLFTHRGYSGPAILNTSHTMILQNKKFDPNYVQSISDLIISDHSPNSYIKVNWTPNISREQWEMKFKFSMSNQPLKNFIHKNSMPNFLPMRLISLLFPSQELSEIKVKNLTKSQIDQIIDTIICYRIDISGNAGLKKAEVTGGGVPLDEINPQTLESLKCKGLYLTGEALDVFGCIGGFNFAWAWITGKLAGESSTKT